MARNQDRGVLFAGAVGPDPRRAGRAEREGGGLLARGGPRGGTATALGSAASGAGAGGVDFGTWRWSPLDLECGGGPVGGSRGVIGFLSRQRTPLGVGSCPVSGRPS